MENENVIMKCLEDPKDQNILIDRLEDEIIDHPTGTGTAQFSDESFQHKLNERANQIQQGGEWLAADPNDPYPDQNTTTTSYQFLYTKPNLVYEYSDHGDLHQELDQWFVASDFASIGLNKLKNMTFPELRLECPPDIVYLDLWQPLEWLDLLVYFTLGNYGSSQTEKDHISQISKNCYRLMMLASFSTTVQLLSRALDASREICDEASTQTFSKVFACNYFKLMTVVYFSLNVALCMKESSSHILPVLSDIDLLTNIVKLCEAWKTNPNPILRARNCLLLHWKLMLVEFGGSDQIDVVDQYLLKKFNVKNKDRKSKQSTKLTCSRVDYFTFEEDLRDKYPMREISSESPADNVHWNEIDDSSSLSTLFLDRLSLSEDKEIFMATKVHSNSLTNHMEIPRTNKHHSVYGSLPGHTVHIATPVPSPPSTPSEFMSGGEKVRKLYHVNQGLPFIYPFEENQKIPEAISEASNLIEDGIYESYLAKRLSKERELFLQRERGNGANHLNNNPVEDKISYDDPGSQESAIASLNRVERYYKSVLRHLRGFVEVLISVVKNSKVELSLRDIESELDPESSFASRFGNEGTSDNKIYDMIYHQLDILRAKETALKAASAILFLSLRWFKLSNPLKAYYFGSLLFDARFTNIMVEFLADSFNNTSLQNFSTENKGMPLYDILSAQNRLINPTIRLPQLSFFKACRGNSKLDAQKFNLVNKVPISKLPRQLDDESKSVVNITEFNRDFCFTLINLLNVTNKILIKNILQRIFIFNDTKPTDLLKLILLNYVNEDLRKPILKIFKKITPFQGRKWRALNMDVISLIYLHMKLTLRDNWLSGKDLENEFKDSLDQETSLRSLLQFYNVRNYPEETGFLGYDSIE